jgi:hypothetical protein
LRCNIEPRSLLKTGPSAQAQRRIDVPVKNREARVRVLLNLLAERAARCLGMPHTEHEHPIGQHIGQGF